MDLKGDPKGKAIIDEAAQLLSVYCASPDCFNKRSIGSQFCESCQIQSKRPISNKYWPRIYFIKQGDFVKIGVSRDIDNRIKALQTGSPDELELLADEYGDEITERWLHELFSNQWHRGEWFRLDDEIINYINCLKQGLGIYKTCEIAFKE